MLSDMSKRSPILKMLADVEDDRKITEFPLAYHFNLSPYKTIDFCDKTKRVCENFSRVLSGLKICKIIILGDVCVGKTCIVNRFCHKLFDTNYKATIGVDFEVEKFEVLNVPFNIQICCIINLYKIQSVDVVDGFRWDTAGQERFKCIAQSYYRSAHVVMVVFDVTNIVTLSHCKNWMKEALDASNSEPFKFLVGTKKDLISEASYTSVETLASKVAKYLEAEYWPLSSKTGENIGRLFFRIAALTFDKLIRTGCEKHSIKPAIGTDLVSFKKKKVEEKSKCMNTSKCN